jgi:RimJ/RimL family protein N-acetyltransferase
MENPALKLIAEKKEDSPWTGYMIHRENEVVGQCAFKYPPKNGKVEIAYYTYGEFQGEGIATEACRQLVVKALATDPTVKITARTLPEKNSSTRILEKNNFRMIGEVIDEEDGHVWEWMYEAP